MDESHDYEINRKYRVLGQTLGMHAQLRERYQLRARIADVVLLVCAVVFCATTFAEARLFEFFGLASESSQVVLGIASIGVFIASLISTLVDWKGSAARHAEAVKKWSGVLEKFREAKSDDGGWAKADEQQLSQTYWEAARNTAPIPELMFNGLKARYLMKVRISTLISERPGCPRFVLWLLVRGTATAGAIGDLRRKRVGLNNDDLQESATGDKRPS